MSATLHSVRRPVFIISSCMLIAAFFAACPAPALDGPANLTGYALNQLQAVPDGESLVSFDWDASGVLYYMTGDPNWGLKLNVYRNTGGVETPIYQSLDLFPGSRITAVGPLVYFNDGGDYGRYTFTYYAYNPSQGGQPTLAYDSAVEPISLWGIDTRDGAQFIASGAVGFGPSSIYYVPAPSDGILNGLVSLGEIGESSGPAAFDISGNLYYAPGYVYAGQAPIFRWAAAEVDAAIANPVAAPLAPAGHIWSLLPATFTGVGGMALDNGGNLYVSANAYGFPGELLLYRSEEQAGAPVPVQLASYSDRIETVRILGGRVYFNCAPGIYSLPVCLTVGLAGDAHVNAVAGKPLSLSVTVSGGSGTLAYQWFLKGLAKTDTPLNNNSPTLSIVPELGDTGMSYYCRVTDAGMTVTSPVYTLDVVRATPALSLPGLLVLTAVISLAVALCGRLRRA